MTVAWWQSIVISYWLDNVILFFQENDSLNEENQSLPGYDTSEDSDFAEDVKNSEPPEYVKQLAVTGT